MDHPIYDVVPTPPFNSTQRGFMRRSTVRLERDLLAARRSECECDEYVGFTCGKHRRIDDLETVLAARKGVTIRQLWASLLQQESQP